MTFEPLAVKIGKDHGDAEVQKSDFHRSIDCLQVKL